MTIKVTKPAINLREKLNELDFDRVPFQKMPAGSVLQVVSNTSSASVATTSSTPQDVISISITPSATSSKIYLMFSGMNQAYGNSQTGTVAIKNNLYRGSTVIGNSEVNSVEVGNMYSTSFYIGFPIAVYLLDSPSSTSQVTYTLKTSLTSSTGRSGYFGNKSLVAMEIAQ